MASEKSTSIYPGEALKGYLRDMGKRGAREGKSRTVERVIQRYRQLVACSLPAWSIDQWMVVVRALQGLDFWNPASVDVLGLVIQQAVEQRRQPGQSDGTNLAYVAKNLPYHARVAVSEVVERYYRHHEALEREPLEQLLLDMGAPSP
jgi:hypothetical protein